MELITEWIPRENNNLLFFDLETTSLDVNKAEIVTFHALSEKNCKRYNLFFKEDKERIRRILDEHDTYVTFNGDNYDIPILDRIYNSGVRRFDKSLKNKKNIDLMKVAIRRGTLLIKEGFKSHSLANICKTLGLEQQKQEGFDYSLLQKNDFTEQEKQTIISYGAQDINATYNLFTFMYDRFKDMKELLPPETNNAWVWFTSSPGSYAYRVICHKAGITPEWPDNNEERKKHDSYDGGYVSTPKRELTKGKIYCLDYNSQYPHAFMMMNLFADNCNCCDEEEKYDGMGLFGIQGRYCSKNFHKVSQALKEIYDERLILKKSGNPKQQRNKIILNSIYGITGSENFKSFYTPYRASDCTMFGRTTIQLARKHFENAGYDVLYSDTDSVYLVDTHNDEEYLIMIKNALIRRIKAHVPFPLESFDMGIDEKIKLIYFPGLKKKNYLYVTEDNDVVIKGLPIIKSNATRLSLKIYNEQLLPRIIKEEKVKYSAKQMIQWIKEYLIKDYSLAETEFKVRSTSDYKKDSQLQSQISKEYGVGVHRLIPVIKNVGVGKGKHYVKYREFKDKKLSWKDIDLSRVVKELEPFCDGVVVNKGNSLFANTLGEWIK